MAAWTAAQDGATKSKQGLGRSGQPRKVGGARWQGTRTKLGSDDDASDDGASDADDDATCAAPPHSTMRRLQCKNDVTCSLPSAIAWACLFGSAGLHLRVHIVLTTFRIIYLPCKGKRPCCATAQAVGRWRRRTGGGHPRTQFGSYSTAGPCH